MKKFTDAEVIQMTKQAPQPVQEVIENIQTAFYIAELGGKHSLHIDQIGVLAELNRNMLLGLVKPEEFLKELIASGISDTDARTITTEINQKIFVPLREQMRKGPMVAAEPAKQATPEVQPSPITKVEPQVQTPPRFFHLENKLAARGAAIPPRPLNNPPSGLSGDRSAQQNGLAAQQSVPVAPIAPQPKPVQSPTAQPSPLATVIGNVLSAQPKVAPQPPRPVVAPSVGGPRPSSSSNIAPLPPKFMSPKSWGSQTSPEPRKMLEDHEEPHIDVSDKVQVISAPAIQKPVSAPLKPYPLPLTPAPQNLPGAMPGNPDVSDKVQVVSQPFVHPSISAPLKPSTLPLTPSAKSYSVDPYREPIE